MARPAGRTPVRKLLPGKVRAIGPLGGPPPAAPSSSSYGTNLIRGLIPRELGGAVDLAFQPEGVVCDIYVPVRGTNAKLTVPEGRPMVAPK